MLLAYDLWGPAVNLATGRLTSIREFAEIAAGVLSIPPEQLRFGAVPVRAEEMQHDPVNVSRLEAWTGWRPATGSSGAWPRRAAPW